MSPSKIEWTDETWNPLAGCSPVSPGCTHCYAATLSRRLAGMAESDLRRGKNPGGKEKYIGIADRRGGTGPNKKPLDVFNGIVHFDEQALRAPLSWKKPRMIFVNSMSDFFHEAVTVDQIVQMLEVMRDCPHHTFQVLTKRAERMNEVLSNRFMRAAIDRDGVWPLPNVWWGVSVEDQKRADERIPWLLKTPAAIRFLSCEPLLGPVNLERAIPCGYYCDESVGHVDHGSNGQLGHIDWVIAGGESGDHARPSHPGWFRTLRDQCASSGVAFLFKQWGEWSPIDMPWEQDSPKSLRDNECWLNLAGGSGFHGDQFWRMKRVGKKTAGRLLDGVQHDAFPNMEVTAQ